MADNVTLPGTGEVVAADEVGGAKVQRVKVQHGADGSATDVSSVSPMPVTDFALGGFVDGVEGLLTTLNGHVDGLESALSTLNGNVDGLEGFTDGIEGGLGASGDAAAAAGGTGSLSAKLRLATSQLDAIKTAVEALDNAISGSEIQVDVVGALPAGTNTIGKLGTNSGVDIGDVDVTSISAGTSLIGDVGLGVRTGSGLTVFRSIDLDETEEEVKGSAGRVYGYYFANLAASVRYLKFYNGTAAAVTVGTTAPVLTLPLPVGASGHVPWPQGIPFSSAITAAATTGLADNDTGAPGANEVVLNVFYA